MDENTTLKELHDIQDKCYSRRTCAGCDLYRTCIHYKYIGKRNEIPCNWNLPEITEQQKNDVKEK